MEQKNYWNSVSDTKTFTTPFQAEEFKKYVSKNDIILDIGCGYGRTLEELHKSGYENLIGVDFAEDMIRKGRKLYPYLDLKVSNGEKIELPDESVDAVILFAVLTCISDDNKQISLLKEIYRVLKPNGNLYINDFLLNTDERNTSRYQKFADKYTYGVFELPEGAICRHHDKKWIISLLSGFKKERFEPLTFTTMNGNKSNGFFFIGSKQ
ncbi:MAG: class I SAM-dependent methyltransferase [Oscillospiraceae bacterium]